MTRAGGYLRRPAGVASGDAALAAALPATALFLFWTTQDGAYADTVWLPSGLFLLALLIVFGAVAAPRLPRAAAAATAALAAFALLNAASISWAGVPGIAWEGANRTLLYLVVFLLFVALPWTPRTAALLLGLFAVGIAAIGMVEVVRVAGDPAGVDGFFRNARLASPLSYPNGTCALMLMAGCPAVIMASLRPVPALARGLLLAAAGVSTECALMCQSRGALVAVPFVALVVLVAAPGRLRIAFASAPVVVAVALSAPAILDVYAAVIDGDPGSRLATARGTMLLSAAALFGFGTAWAVVDRRVILSLRVRLAVGRIAAAAAAAVTLAGAVVTLSLISQPLARANSWWHDFTANTPASEQTPHLFAGIGSNRYDIWRVAFDEFRHAPLVGIGSDNFAAEYLHEGRTTEQPLYPHSLELRILSQLGVVGTAFFGAFLAVAAVAVWRGIRHGSELARGATLAAAAVFLYWIVHGSMDWFWEIPALGAPALAWLAVALRLSSPRAVTESSWLGHRAGRALGAAACVATAASFAFPWAASKEVAIAASGWNANPSAALRRLDLARILNPLSDTPDTVAGVIAARSGDARAERRAFAAALQRNPANWYALLELGLLDLRTGRRSLALQRIHQARALDPRDPVLALVQQRVARGELVSQAELDRLVLGRIGLLTGARQS